MDDLEQQRERRRLADEVLDTPNCPRCLTRLDAVGDDIGEQWICPTCGESATQE